MPNRDKDDSNAQIGESAVSWNKFLRDISYTKTNERSRRNLPSFCCEHDGPNTDLLQGLHSLGLGTRQQRCLARNVERSPDSMPESVGQSSFRFKLLHLCIQRRQHLINRF